MPVESKRARFVTLAEGRMTKALNDIRLIGNLGTTALYEYTPADVSAMRTRLVEATNAAFAKFRTPQRRVARPEFTLPAETTDESPETDNGRQQPEHANGSQPLAY